MLYNGGIMVEKNSGEEQIKGITKISVKGFKSLAKETSIEIKPLTILAGSNNSGKSSIMQPLLMMKQTIEEATESVSDLDIDGNHVSYNTPEEFFSKINGIQKKRFTIKVDLDTNLSIVNIFKKSKIKLVELTDTIYQNNNNVNEKIAVYTKLDIDKFVENNPVFKVFAKSFSNGFNQIKNEEFLNSSNELNLKDLGIGLCVRRKRCLLGLAIDKLDPDSDMIFEPVFLPVGQEHQQIFEKYILDIIHVPADRGSPERSYKATAVGKRYKGPISDYVASILYNWKQNNAPELITLKRWLQMLELTSHIDADLSSDNRVRILIDRLPINPNNKISDMVNITDVGFGTSQVLVVLVALLVAKKNQLVYIEQPEVHLHPRAQYKLASCISEIANRGVHVVVETHSELLLIGIQTLIAGRELSSNDVKLHWFERSNDGTTRVRSGTMDKNGAYGEWPVDFADISYEANREYLKATGFIKRT